MSAPDRRTVTLSREAADDFEDLLVRGTKDWGAQTARTYGVLLLEAIERLGAFPDLGPEVPEIGPGIRRLVFRRHIAIYAAGEQSLTVLRIIHQKQDVRRAVLP